MNAREATDLIRSLAPVGGVYPVRDWPAASRRWAVAQLAEHFQEHEAQTGLRPYIPRWLLAEMPAQAGTEVHKAVQIANAPGLYFDSMSHRWRRAESQDEAGVHLDPVTRRAHVVEFPRDPNDPEGFHEDVHEPWHQQTAKMNGTLEHFERGTLEFKAPGSDRHAVVIPDASEPGRWRYSEYEPVGFTSHKTFDGPHEAAAAAGAAGYTEPAPGSLDRLAGTEEWARGTRSAKITQLSNALGFARHHAARRAVDDHFADHGFSQEAHDRIMQPAVLEALRRGEVPEALKAIGESLKALYGHAHAEPPPPDHTARAPEVQPLRRRQRREHPFAGTIEIPGLPRIHVETSKGEYRRGIDRDGTTWAVRMPCHYGEFENSEGADGDPLDVFVGPNTHAAYVYVIHLKHPGTQEYDEDKVFVGFDAKADVLRTFAAAYNRPGFKGGMRRLTFPQLAEWLSERRNRGNKITVGEVLKSPGGRLITHTDLRAHHRDRLHGGAADNMDPRGFNPDDLAAGTEHEKEHTDDQEIAQEIAMDHLAEDPDHYRDEAHKAIRDDWRMRLAGPAAPGQDASREEVEARLDWVKHQIAALANPHPDEVAKAVARGDTRTLSMFDLMDAGGAAHEGLHAERRTDKTGRTETRWVSDPSPPTGRQEPAPPLTQIGEPRARRYELGPTQGPRAGRMFEGLGDAPSPPPLADDPDLSAYDVILVNTSAGKDSQAMLDYVMDRARKAGVADRVVTVHADLGRVEWEGTRELAEEQAKHYGVRFEVVQRPQGDLLQQIEERAQNLAQREQDVATLARNGITTWAQLANTRADAVAFMLGGDAERARKLQQAAARKSEAKGGDERIDFGKSVAWPSSSARYCTSDHKRGQVQTLITRLTAEQQAKAPGRKVRILNCMGLRADESAERAKKTPFTQDERTTKREVDDWLPIHHWSEADVWRRIRDAGTKYHRAYDLGMSRLSCVFCVFASKKDLQIARQHNPALFQEYVDLERRIGHKFRANMALAELADAAESQEAAEVHKSVAESMPAALRWED